MRQPCWGRLQPRPAFPFVGALLAAPALFRPPEPAHNCPMPRPSISQRSSLRLRGYDYSQPGVYFVTICTHGHKSLF